MTYAEFLESGIHLAKQTQKVLDYLAEHRMLTSLEAVYKLKVTRLPARIWDLRHKVGLNITGALHYEKDADGNWTHWTEYCLHTGEVNQVDIC